MSLLVAAVAVVLLAACGGGVDSGSERGPSADRATSPSVASTTTTTAPPPPLLDRIAFVGDSLGENLALGLRGSAATFGVDVANDAISGCGVARSGAYRLGGRDHELSEVCAAWSTTWDGWLRRDRPKVVAIQVGRHEVLDRVHEGRWTNILDPTYAAYVRAELEEAVSVAGEDGARVVLLTAPYYRASTTTARAEDDPARVVRFNELLHETAAGDDRVSVIDLGGLVSPDGAYASRVDGIVVRPDGVHYSEGGVAWMAPWLLPQLVDLVGQVPG